MLTLLHSSSNVLQFVYQLAQTRQLTHASVENVSAIWATKNTVNSHNELS